MKFSLPCTVLLAAVFFSSFVSASANTYTVNPTNYTGFYSALSPGDTMLFTAGNYTNQLKLVDMQGLSGQEIVFAGVSQSAVVFLGNACCNTVSLTRCAFLKIMNLTLDGQSIPYVDGVKAEGTAGNWTHHITIENLRIVGHGGGDQQTVGISTKCASWNWIIRKNVIDGAGTGLYLGNSNGDAPFVNGLIEYNLVTNSIGYNMQVKHQLNGVRDAFAGTAVNGKTTIRHNVFCKENNASTGGNARPNLLVGGFPLSGWGSQDYYEIYGNFFYQNPVEALFQGTGNIMLYNNIFVNHFDPSGFRAVYFTSQNGVQPQDIRVFHNTIWAANSSGGLRLNNANPAYQQYCAGNAVFAPQAITNFANATDNTTDTYGNASTYVLSAGTTLNALNLYPKSGQLSGTPTNNTLFTSFTDWNLDFNGHVYDWTYRGAYAGCCQNPGWQLQLDTIPELTGQPSPVWETEFKTAMPVALFPNPVNSSLHIAGLPPGAEIEIFDAMGIRVWTAIDTCDVPVQHFTTGVYFLSVQSGKERVVMQFVKE